MIKLLQTLAGQFQKYPSAKGYARKAVEWVGRQPEIVSLWNRVSFTVNLGDFPELGVQGFSLAKTSGTNKVFGSDAKKTNFPITTQSLLRNAKKQAALKKSDAVAKASDARSKAVEAQRLAAEATQLAELAENESNSFDSAVKQFAL